MDDLISRKAWQRRITEMIECVTNGDDAYYIGEKNALWHVEREIKKLPSVPAVPLDKLCEWLSENSINIPCESCPNFSNDYCTAIGDMSKPCPKTVDSWRQAITKWMEASE